MKLRNITYRIIKITNWMKCLRKSLVISFWCSFVVPFTTPSACKIKSLAILPWCSFCFPFTTTFLWEKKMLICCMFLQGNGMNGKQNQHQTKIIFRFQNELGLGVVILQTFAKWIKIIHQIFPLPTTCLFNVLWNKISYWCWIFFL